MKDQAKAIKDIVDIAQKIGCRPDYIQGGGGNISIKETGVMFIKASGFRFDELSVATGFVAVDHDRIKNSYTGLEHEVGNTGQINLLMTKIANESIYENRAQKGLRPSMEIGFHALLEHTVIHTHSVYANILNCTQEGRVLIAELFPEALDIPYAMPGLPITVAIKERRGVNAQNVLFLENHGLIVVGETPTQAYKLHDEVNRRIRAHLPQIAAYPKIALSETERGFASASPFVKKFITEHPGVVEFFERTVLFPDQAVYGQALTNGSIALNPDSGTITYTTGRREALAFEETFVAWAFILESIDVCGFTRKTLPETECARLLELESEKYRTALAKKS